MSKFSNLWTKWSEKGLKFPFVNDPVTNKPSITLMFPYITFVASIISLILLHIWPSMILATSTTIMFWAISVIFYMIRKLNKTKIDFANRSIELDAGDESD
ncbi:MAG: hypothetical protein COB41_00495 [Proteobacteria bacterium]|nr:MAG: hypothetical protein COB41_00495 [Pseudomonadota bacterium]